ncbi:MAG: class I SAM-dependent methyltransferase [Halieaceae bacterium]|jgi:2-polyprenyl-3-methyl-5-hydroxy-6-metoxy-1,4-benzoquinol methylase|nr:class I SAM-dependent methyltransferase [Halieaceae bacterium]
MTTDNIFWDWIAGRYAKQAVADEASYKKKLAISQQYFDADSRVLEFGCGTGSTAIHHAPVVGHIHATDISSKMLAIAKTKAGAAELNNISFEQTGLKDLNSSNESWDAVLGMSILHLVANKDSEIERAFELLKPGGVFISSTPCIGDSGLGFRLLAPIFRWIPLLPTISVFSQQELITSLQSAGFHIEHSGQPGGDMVAFIVARKLNRASPINH